MTEHEFNYQRVELPDAGAVVYRMDGVFGDTSHCYEFLEAFLEALDTCPPRIVFNLTQLDNMYSSGIGILANCFSKAGAVGKTLSLCGVSPVIHRTLTITGVQPMLKEYATEEEALAAPAE